MIRKSLEDKLKGSKLLSTKDIKFMGKLGFADEFIEVAKTNGCFRFGKISINWNLAWNEESNFFFEITRNSFPIGIDEQKNYIYVSDITSKSSKIGLLNPKTLQYATIANSLDELLINVETIFPYEFLRNLERQKLFNEGDRVHINIHNSNVGDVDHFLPFGTNTRGKITRKAGEYIAEYESSTSSKRTIYTRDRITWIGLALLSAAYFLIFAKLEVKFSTQLAIYLIVLFGLSPLIMFWQRLNGNWHRL